MSVQFERLPSFTAAHAGLWWNRGDHRDRYPICEERPPAEPSVEHFGPGGTINVRFGPAPTPATWFLSKARDELVQIQPDRFTRNWSKVTDAAYPSYSTLQPMFAHEYDAFREFVVDAGLHPPVATQCELTYINPMRAGSVWTTHGQVARVLASWSGDLTENFLPEPEDVQIVARYVMRNAAGTVLGRLSVAIQPVYDPAGQPLLMLTHGSRTASRRRPIRCDRVLRPSSRVDSERLHHDDHHANA